MAKDCPRAIDAALHRILRPLVRLLLTSGISYLELAEIAKRLYVELAMQEPQIPGRKASVSRAAVLTGLSRKEVQKLLRRPPLPVPALSDQYNRAARVVAGWVRDPQFHVDGRPAPLPTTGEGASFATLVKRYSGDIPPRAVLDELVRVQAVRVDADGAVHLLAPAYIPRELAARIEILGTDVGYLIDTIRHNLDAPPAEARYQRKVMYDNLPDQAVAELRPEIARRCQQLLEELDRLMASRDRDCAPQAGSGRRRAGVGLYYFENDESGPRSS